MIESKLFGQAQGASGCVHDFVQAIAIIAIIGAIIFAIGFGSGVIYPGQGGELLR